MFDEMLQRKRIMTNEMPEGGQWIFRSTLVMPRKLEPNDLLVMFGNGDS